MGRHGGTPPPPEKKIYYKCKILAFFGQICKIRKFCSVVTVSHLARSVDFGSVLRNKTAVSVRFGFHFTTQQQSVVTAPAVAVTK